ncbi:glycoside hydrolase domain-containing protein [Kribbella deserti]|uniref:Glycoside hydrolase domain-containing protein n=1 Tax=Kribbella deserti TaxID=1926257 RepID=A0ABV6QQS4_9ACTN
MRSVIRLVLAAALVSTVTPVADAARAPTSPVSIRAQALPGVDHWTEPSSTSVFRNSLPTKESGRRITLDAARNEEESAQVVLRSAAAFSIDAVSFSPLTGGTTSIPAANLSYTFLGYKYLNRNTRFAGQELYPVVRKAPGDFPDPLSNARSMAVPARTSQSIWLTVAVPKELPAGVYAGHAKIATSKGELLVPFSVDVRAVTLPDPKDGVFETSLWHTFAGELSWKPNGQTIEETYQYQRFTPQWRELMEKLAVQMKRHRTNTITLPLVGLLLDGNTTVTDNTSATGRYQFDWSRFDEVVQIFVAAGVGKRLEGFWVSADTDNWGRPFDSVREVEIIDRPSGSGRGQRNYANWDSPKARNFIDQFIPALREHLAAKRWTDELKYWMHIGDEPHGDNEETAWRGIAARVRSHWPDVRLGDATFHEPWASRLAPEMSVMVPNMLNYDANRAHWDGLRAQGKDLYLYNCNIPVANYLNRFIDQPQFNQRLTGWYAYSRGANGYLHYSMNGWLANLDEVNEKGDHYIVWPDKENNTIQSSIRYESLRDGIEDYETLALLGRMNPGLARDLATSLTETADKYSPDTQYQARIRKLVLDAAAGRPIAPDLARNTSTSASSSTPGSEPAKAVDGDATTAWRPAGTGAQWLQLDLGRQTQLDGVKLNWSTQYAGTYQILTSYDGARWTTAATTSGGNGSDDFVGLNAKARLIRIQIGATGSTYGLDSVEVAGAPLTKVNLLGGRSYTVSPAPSNQPDSGFESTDGVLADAWSDGRTYGFGAGQTTATVTVDLGASRVVDNARIHAYEEYPGYRPDQVTVSTSTDGTTYHQRGWLPGTTNDQAGIWYDLDFPPTAARYVRITFHKTYTSTASVMLVDEIEVYASTGPANLASAAPYTKAPAPHVWYPDSGNRESTDGIIAGRHDDGLSHGYRFDVGSTGTARVTIDLGTAKPLTKVMIRDNFDNATKYSPDTVRVLAGNSPTALTPVGTAGVSSAQWFRIDVQPVTARYVQVEYEKYAVGTAADWVFVDEIAVY